jgi:hypothetical protein
MWTASQPASQTLLLVTSPAITLLLHLHSMKQKLERGGDTNQSNGEESLNVNAANGDSLLQSNLSSGEE